MLNNPFAGPAHVVALANSLDRERRPGAYTRPPPTGGAQISVRLADHLMTHLDILGQRSGWTRIQVLTALLERGLFDLYDQLSDETGEALMDDLTNQLVPTMQGESGLTRLARRVAREVVGESCVLSNAHRPEQFWVEGARRPSGIPRMRVAIDRAAAEDYARASSEGDALDGLRDALGAVWADAEASAGTEVHLLVTPAMLLPRHLRSSLGRPPV